LASTLRTPDASSASRLIAASFPRYGPAVLRQVELHPRELVFLLEEDALAEPGEIDRRRRLRRGAGRLHPGLRALEVVDLHAEVIEPVAFGIGVRGFPGALPADNRDVDVAVSEVDLARQLAVAAADLLQPESLLEQLRGRERVLRGDCDMPNSCHAHVLVPLPRSGPVGQQPLQLRLHFLRISPLAANAPVPEPAADGVRALAVRADFARDARDGLDPRLAARSVVSKRFFYLRSARELFGEDRRILHRHAGALANIGR